MPLLVGHLRHLEAEDVDPVMNPGDLGTAIRICSMPPERWLAWRYSRWTPLRLAVWGRMLGQWDFMEKLALWRDYIQWHTELPVITFKGDASDSAIPSYRLTRVRMMRIGYAASEVDSTPYLEALWDMATDSEMNGSATVCGFTEEEMDSQASLADIDGIVAKATEELAEKLKGN